MTPMSWPSGQEYSDAVQDSRIAFEDAELQAGKVETDRNGLPRPRSGNFAVVYKVECGRRNWAVKCFTREVPGQQSRYAEISSYLRRSAIPYTVDFDYFKRGVRVRGQWFPALKMEWVAGDSLIKFVETRLRDSASIRSLAARWVAMVAALRAAGIAHGDLQHGNVLVVGGDLKLVDYDGMFVPSLAGATAVEVGHPNYQHPGREQARFGPELDNFSAWVIYLSLVAFSIDPSLWSRVKAGDDCLLFRARDFAPPGKSEVLDVLNASRDEGLRSLGALFAELVRLRVEQIPPLDAAKIPIDPSAARTPSRGASWIDDHVRPAAFPPVREGPSEQEEVIDASWVLEFIAEPSIPADARFVHDLLWLRLGIIFSILLAAVASLSTAGPTLPTAVVSILAATNMALIAARYRREPGVAALRQARVALSEVEDRCRQAAQKVAELETQASARISKRDSDLHSLHVRTRRVNEQTDRDIETVRARLEKDCAQTQRRQKQIDREEQQALAKVGNTLGTRAANLRSQLQALNQEESGELAKELSSLKTAHVQSALASAGIANAYIPGVGHQLKGVLMANGITCAQQVDRWKVHRISGFGPTRVAAVVAWAGAVEQGARASMPTSLSAYQMQAIRGKYTSRRQTFGDELQRLEQQQRSEEAGIKANAASMRQEVDNVEAVPRATAAGEIELIQQKRDSMHATLRAEEVQIAESAKAELAQLDVRIAELRRAALGLQWTKARAAAQVKRYASVSLGSYVLHIGFLRGEGA